LAIFETGYITYNPGFFWVEEFLPYFAIFMPKLAQKSWVMLWGVSLQYFFGKLLKPTITNGPGNTAIGDISWSISFRISSSIYKLFFQ